MELILVHALVSTFLIFVLPLLLLTYWQWKKMFQIANKQKKLYAADKITDFLKELLPYYQYTPPQHLTDGVVNVVPRYSIYHNLLIDKDLLRQIKQMDSADFLRYVLTKLSLEQVESLMVDETQRRRTFPSSWRHSGNLSRVAMAKAGLYYQGIDDRVKCAFCRVLLQTWETDDVPSQRHATENSDCRFVRGFESGIQCVERRSTGGNDGHGDDNYDNDHVRHVTNLSRSTLSLTTNDVDVEYARLNIDERRQNYNQRNALICQRMSSFDRWQYGNRVSGECLCEAGFYSSGFDDEVLCFYCGGGLRNWAEGDDPWEEHARWFPDCSFLIYQKGNNYIGAIGKHTPANKKRKTEAEKKARWMKEVCQEYFNHSFPLIDFAIERHGGPFDSVSDMLEAIDALAEEADNSAPSHANSQQTAAASGQSDTTSLPLSSGDTSLEDTHIKGKCRDCDSPANHIGLPCAHLIYCDSCNAKQQKLMEESQYTIHCMCPFPRCQKVLGSTMKVFMV